MGTTLKIFVIEDTLINELPSFKVECIEKTFLLCNPPFHLHQRFLANPRAERRC